MMFWLLLVFCVCGHSVFGQNDSTILPDSTTLSDEISDTTTLTDGLNETSTIWDGIFRDENPPPAELDYYSMPALSELDDFDLCLRKPNAVYCIVDMQLKEDNSPLYQFIKNYSTYYFKNYKHDKLHRGVCANQHCGLNLTHANVTENTILALKKCFNTSIHKGYGLEVDSLSVRYCKTSNDSDPIDVLDIVIGALLLLLLLVNLGCSAYYFLFPPNDGREANPYMLAFCVQKNWKALKNGGSADGGLFKCFQALRFYTMVMILGLHSMIFIGYGYTANPEFIEHVLHTFSFDQLMILYGGANIFFSKPNKLVEQKLFSFAYHDFFKSLLFNARIIVQIFFLMGGFLMAYKMFQYAENHKFTLKTVPMAIINRWFRLMPAVLVVMGLAMTWVPHLGSGPMWDAVVKREREMCRNNWWQLVILSPNLFPFEYLCLPQAWYLGTDTQLFLITMVVLLIIWKWPKSAVPVLSSVMVISLLIPFLQSYFMDLLPIRVSIFPESIRDIFGYNDTFYHAYVSAQGNWAGYHLGVITAYFYHKAQSKKWDLHNSMFMKLLFISSVPIAVGAVLMGWDLHHREASAFEAAIFNSLNQNFFALAMCVFVIGYFYRANPIYVGAVEWGPLQPLGRLSYCAMLLHATILRTYGGQMRRSFYATDYTAIMLFGGIVAATYLWSLPLYLFVEAPSCQLQKLLLGPKRRPRKQDEDSNGNQVKPGISTMSVSTVSTHI